jgi:short-subunit dehydrogenase
MSVGEPAEDLQLAGARVLVTGASSGIGAALAVAFAQRGATVGLTARRTDRLDAVLAQCQQHAPGSRRWTFDFAEPDAPERLAAAVHDELGGIDILVNNAGIPKRRTALDLTVAEVEAVTRINLLAPIRLTLAVLPSMVAQGSGHIVNISSVAARLSPASESVYSATKAGITAFSESLAVELWPTPVSVHVINPGVVDTELFTRPGNDPLVADVEAIPVDDMVEPVMEAIRTDRFETWVPAWFADVAKVKADDLPGFLQGSAEYMAQQQAAGGGKHGTA